LEMKMKNVASVLVRIFQGKFRAYHPERRYMRG